MASSVRYEEFKVEALAEHETTGDEIEPPAGFSRNPVDYSPTDHFLVRFANGFGPASETRVAPEITSEVIAECIRNGELKPGHGGRWRLETEVGGHRWRLVVSIEDGQRLVQTALVPGVHQPDDHDPDARFGGGRR